MLKKNRLKLVISSIVVLLPSLFGIIMWKDLPEVITTHWGVNGNADGFSGKGFAVFGVPIILLALHLLCLVVTSLDKKQKNQNQKALGVIFWIVPFVSLFTNGIMYRAAFGQEVDLAFWVSALLGAMFIFIGNYLPKVKQNKTLGIKISWTLKNEENWNKTHRFGGKVWVGVGIILLLSVFLPVKITMLVAGCAIIASVISPVVYSYFIYRQHQKQGVVYAKTDQSNSEKIAKKISIVVGLIILLGVAFVAFSGSIDVQCGDTALTIEATYWTDLEIDYSEIESVEYRKELAGGVRTYGFGSPKLALGIFQNDEFGSYTLYSYTDAKEFIVLSSSDKTLVIGMSDVKQTQEIYNAISEKIEE